MNRIRRLCFLFVCSALGVMAPAHGAGADTAQAVLPVFDAHLHYNWEPAPHMPLDSSSLKPTQ